MQSYAGSLAGLNGRHPGRNDRTIRGFTLYELLVTLAIAHVLMVMSFGVGAVLHDTRLVASVNGLLTSLALARSESVKRQMPVSICKSADGQQCSAAAGWGDGWLVFVDRDRDGWVDPEETIILVQASQVKNVRIAYRGQPVWARNRYVTYLPTGLTDNHNGSFYICDHRGTSATREVVLFKSGRARSVLRSGSSRAQNCA